MINQYKLQLGDKPLDRKKPATDLGASIPHFTTEKARAFEIFKSAYPSGGWIDGQKTLLREKYGEAKALGEVANRLRSPNRHDDPIPTPQIVKPESATNLHPFLTPHSEHLKDKLSIPEEEAPDEPRSTLRAQVAENVTKYREAYQKLKDLKIEIEHLQHLLEQARVRLTRDFEHWYLNVYLGGEGEVGGSGGEGEGGMMVGMRAPSFSVLDTLTPQLSTISLTDGSTASPNPIDPSKSISSVSSSQTIFSSSQPSHNTPDPVKSAWSTSTTHTHRPSPGLGFGGERGSAGGGGLVAVSPSPYASTSTLSLPSPHLGHEAMKQPSPYASTSTLPSPHLGHEAMKQPSPYASTSTLSQLKHDSVNQPSQHRSTVSLLQKHDTQRQPAPSPHPPTSRNDTLKQGPPMNQRGDVAKDVEAFYRAREGLLMKAAAVGSGGGGGGVRAGSVGGSRGGTPTPGGGGGSGGGGGAVGGRGVKGGAAGTGGFIGRLMSASVAGMMPPGGGGEGVEGRR
ncbi:hypothetical protein HDU67_000506 [Dinochytrium kinnereticum]|nr:hypothetical protein HDU67_000506 [Dinochytrium kinnereticum]